MSASAKIQFHHDVVRLLRMFPGIVAYAEEVGRVGSLEQAADEAEERAKRANDVSLRVEAAREEILHDANYEAENIKAAGAVEYERLVAEGRRIVAAAGDEAEKTTAAVVADIGALRAAAQAKLDGVLTEVRVAQVSHDEERARVEEIRKQHAKVSSDLATAREDLRVVRAEIQAIRDRLAK